MPRSQPVALSAVTFLMLLLLSQLTPAQPGNEAQVIHGLVSSLQERIAEASRHIEAKPGDAQPYAARGLLYMDLYRALYESYYKHFYSSKPPELTAAAITTKAIEDFGRAIEISPSAELYYKRGEMYEARWADTVTTMRYGVWKELSRQRSPGDMWTLLTRPPTENAELDAFGRLVADPDFASAARDYSEALRLNKDAELAKEIHAEIARLFLSRTRAFPLFLPSIKKVVNEPNQYGYSIWADFDNALEHLSKSDRAEESKLVEPNWDWVWPQDISRSKAYFEKAMLAVSYGKYNDALDALNLAEKYFDTGRAILGYSDCEIRSERSRVRVKMGQFDAAIADASGPGQQGIFCYKSYEPRGDAYFAKGDWRAAVADYTAGLDDWNSGTSVNAYRNRALAYAQLGEAEKAIHDLSYYFYRAEEPKKPEDYRLRAQLYRKIGKQELAATDEKTAEEIVKAARSTVEKEFVLGEIKLPAGVPFDRMKVEVMFVDAANPKKRLWTTVGDDARFIASYEKGRSFTIHVTYDGVKDGQPARFFGHTQKLTARGTVGPITITLNQFAQKK
jgi:tetratricopeptide (TPR) repeat protein